MLPQVGAGARKTNYDYTHGQLPELIDVIIASKARLFVAAVGVPPKEVVDKLHKAGIPVMNMIGHPKHAVKAIAAGVDVSLSKVFLSTIADAVDHLCSGRRGRRSHR